MKPFILDFKFRQMLENEAGLKFSDIFFNCMLVKIGNDFRKKTGIENDKRIHLKTSEERFEPNKKQIDAIFFIEPIVFNYPIKICWSSKSNIQYLVSNETINCEDIDFWIEGLDVQEFLEYRFYGKKIIPFKLKKLPYQVEVEILSLDQTFEISLISSELPLKKQIKDHIDNTIRNLNEDSINGLIKSITYNEIDIDKVQFFINFGNVEVTTVKKIIESFAGIDGISKIVVY